MVKSSGEIGFRCYFCYHGLRDDFYPVLIKKFSDPIQINGMKLLDNLSEAGMQHLMALNRRALNRLYSLFGDRDPRTAWSYNFNFILVLVRCGPKVLKFFWSWCGAVLRFQNFSAGPRTNRFWCVDPCLGRGNRKNYSTQNENYMPIQRKYQVWPFFWL